MAYIGVKIQKLAEDAIVPKYQTQGAVGMDVHSMIDYTLKAGECAMIPTGLALQIPYGYECQVRPRSGLAAKCGVTVLNTPGTIDSDYRGEVKVLLMNHHPGMPCVIKKGDRIAQLVFAPIAHADIEIVEELDPTERGTGGFGSTGK